MFKVRDKRQKERIKRDTHTHTHTHTHTYLWIITRACTKEFEA